MTPAPTRSTLRRATVVLALGAVLAACGPGATAIPTAQPTPAGTGANATCPTVAPPPMAAGEERLVVIETELGNIEVSIQGDLGPLAAANFVALVACGYYDGVVFHRTIPGFMIQGGDPTGTGRGGPGYEFPNDPATLPYERGVIAMANAGRDTNGSQFFIVLEEYGPPAPDYSKFGQVTSGMEVADAIAAAADGELPSDPIVILSMSLTGL